MQNQCTASLITNIYIQRKCGGKKRSVAGHRLTRYIEFAFSKTVSRSNCGKGDGAICYTGQSGCGKTRAAQPKHHRQLSLLLLSDGRFFHFSVRTEDLGVWCFSPWFKVFSTSSAASLKPRDKATELFCLLVAGRNVTFHGRRCARIFRPLSKL